MSRFSRRTFLYFSAAAGLVNPWGQPTPAVYDPECFYWENPS